MAKEHEDLLIPAQSAFPISQFSAEYAARWCNSNIRSDMGRETALLRMHAMQPELGEFLGDMEKLRSTFYGSVEFKKGYESGSIFMFEALRNEYQSTLRLFPNITKTDANMYFQDLLDIENNHFEIEKLKAEKEINPKIALSPLIFREIMHSSKDSASLSRLIDSFMNISEYKAEDLTHEEVGRALTPGGIGTQLGNTHSMLMGAIDVYEIVKRAEEKEMWENRISWDLK